MVPFQPPKVGQLERKTQNRIVGLFCNRLGYDYLGNWEEREGNSNVEEGYLRPFLTRAGYSETLISKAIDELKKAAGQSHVSLYDLNKEVYSLLRYGIKVHPPPLDPRAAAEVCRPGAAKPREYVSGESHYLFGKRYRLEVVVKDAPPEVRLKGKTKLILQIRPDSAVSKRREVMAAWYRQQLQPLAEKLITKWQTEIRVSAASWDIRQMKTRWGSCSSKSGRVLINLELAKKPVACLEYIIVHELLHLIEKTHNDRFVELMTKYVPKWQAVKAELNSFILSHEKWEY